jgi:hypothetical protein
VPKGKHFAIFATGGAAVAMIADDDAARVQAGGVEVADVASEL